MCKCCGRARSVSQKCKIKGKWKSDRRWKRAIRPATAEWVSAMLSDTARRHYKLWWLWCPSTGSRAVIATIRHFVTRHYEFCSVHPLQKPAWERVHPAGGHINASVITHSIKLQICQIEDKCAGLIMINLLSLQNGLPPGVQARDCFSSTNCLKSRKLGQVM